jgi:hypothetical protein
VGGGTTGCYYGDEGYYSPAKVAHALGQYGGRKAEAKSSRYARSGKKNAGKNARAKKKKERAAAEDAIGGDTVLGSGHSGQSAAARNVEGKGEEKGKGAEGAGKRVVSEMERAVKEKAGGAAGGGGAAEVEKKGNVKDI